MYKSVKNVFEFFMKNYFHLTSVEEIKNSIATPASEACSIKLDQCLFLL